MPAKVSNCPATSAACALTSCTHRQSACKPCSQSCNPLLVAVCREFDERGFTELPGRDGDAIHVDCWFAPPEPAHYRDAHGQPRLQVTVSLVAWIFQPFLPRLIPWV